MVQSGRHILSLDVSRDWLMLLKLTWCEEGGENETLALEINYDKQMHVLYIGKQNEPHQKRFSWCGTEIHPSPSWYSFPSHAARTKQLSSQSFNWFNYYKIQSMMSAAYISHAANLTKLWASESLGEMWLKPQRKSINIYNNLIHYYTCMCHVCGHLHYNNTDENATYSLLE